MKINDHIRGEISSIVGEKEVFTTELERFSYSYDSSFILLSREHLPDIVVRPGGTMEVARLMELASRYRIPVVPRGAASGRTGGSIPVNGGMVIALDRMTKILELDENNMTVLAEPGVRTLDLYQHCARVGLFYPPDPASWKVSTIGGNIAENAGGMRAVKYGVTADYVMGLEVVLASGRILTLGGKAVKNVTGYDLKSLFVGSEGTLGIVTKALLKVISLPKQRQTIRIMFGSLDDGCRTVHQLLRSGTIPAAAEIMDRLSLDAVARTRPVSFAPETAACLIVEIDGEDDNSLAAQSREVSRMAGENGALRIETAASEAEAEELWALRRGVSSALAALAPNRVSEDISVPRNAFPEMVRRIQEIARKGNLVISVYGHAGDGNLHPSILCNLADPEEYHRVEEAIDGIFATAVELGGTLSGEHGIGITKRPYLSYALGSAEIETMKEVKLALDPLGILNPGKIW